MTLVVPHMMLRKSLVTHWRVWRALDRLVRGASTSGALPRHAYFPARSIARLLGPDDARQSAFPPARAYQTAALATWSLTRGVYAFDPALRAALEADPFSGPLELDRLVCLPEPAVYVETPGTHLHGSRVNGFFAYIDYDPAHARDCLCVVYASAAGELLAPAVFPLGLGSFAQSCAAATACAMHATGRFDQGAHAESTARLQADYAEAVSLVLYLCCSNADIAFGNRTAWPRLGEMRSLAVEARRNSTQRQVGRAWGAQLRQQRLERETHSARESARTHPNGEQRAFAWFGLRLAETVEAVMADTAPVPSRWSVSAPDRAPGVALAWGDLSSPLLLCGRGNSPRGAS